MIENQLYNLLIIQTISPLIADIFKNIISNHKSLLIELININTILLFFGFYYFWKYKYDISSVFRNIFRRKKVIYKIDGTIHYAQKEILQHNKDNMKNIKYIVHYIINIVKPVVNRKTTYHINTVNPEGIKIYRIPTNYIFTYKGEEIETLYKEYKDSTELNISLVIKARNYEIIDDLIKSSYVYHKKTIDDVDTNNFKDYIYIPRTANSQCNFMLYNQYNYKNNSSFDDLFIDNKELLLRHLSDFKEGKSYHKFLSLLLHGKPGTGKTSIIKMIAKYFNRSIIYIKLNEVFNMRNLLQIIHSNEYEIETTYDEFKSITVNKKKIIVFEDIDACSGELIKKREESNDKKKKGRIDDNEESKLTLDDILNVLNGVIPNNDLIFIMTTNHIEKIDNALIRPGRITLNMELNEITKPTICLMINKYYPDLTLKQINNDVKLELVIPCILENIIKNTYSYSELINIINNDKEIEKYNIKYKN
jgi:hypothetical protein